MKDKRPVNLDITTLKFSVVAIASILHRISGMGLFLGVSVLLYFLQISLASQSEFNRVESLFDSGLIKLLIWLIMLSVFYHLLAGIKHLLLDMGIGESKKGAKNGAIITLALFAIAASVGALWLW